MFGEISPPNTMYACDFIRNLLGDPNRRDLTVTAHFLATGLVYFLFKRDLAVTTVLFMTFANSSFTIFTF